jgi:hypothetical protein
MGKTTNKFAPEAHDRGLQIVMDHLICSPETGSRDVRVFC